MNLDRFSRDRAQVLTTGLFEFHLVRNLDRFSRDWAQVLMTGLFEFPSHEPGQVFS